MGFWVPLHYIKTIKNQITSSIKSKLLFPKYHKLFEHCGDKNYYLPEEYVEELDLHEPTHFLLFLLHLNDQIFEFLYLEHQLAEPYT